MVAVALTASNAYTHTQRFVLDEGTSVDFGGYTFTYLGVEEATDSRRTSLLAQVQIDGGDVYEPAISRYTQSGMLIGTPSVRTSFVEDIYLTLDEVARNGGPATIRVAIKPLIIWIWIGGAIVVLGTLLAIYPGQRRRLPTDPVSAPVGVTASHV
jgi:cytochrome c-type biogenesis protein CcmF